MSESSQMNPPLIDVRDASKTYGNGLVKALDGVSIAIHAGDFVSIMGPSGCGKSTLLNLIGALDLPTSGEVLFRGKAIQHPAELDQLRSREIGFVFQSFLPASQSHCRRKRTASHVSKAIFRARRESRGLGSYFKASDLEIAYSTCPSTFERPKATLLRSREP